MNLNTELKKLFNEQVSGWELAKTNFENLSVVQTKKIAFDDFDILVQFNPARIVSSGADTSAKTIADRKCFLCENNLPPEQKSIDYKDYLILINPYPIFPEHFTIPRKEHVQQRILPYFKDMLLLAKDMSDYTVFYNGPKCGASAPDHMHFQAGTKTFLPLINDYKRLKSSKAELLKSADDFSVFTLKNYLRTLICIESENAESVFTVFQNYYKEWQIHPDEEPLMNIVCSFENNKWYVFILPRENFRPWQYYSTDTNKQLLVSPATVEMSGIFITPIETHFNRIDRQDIADILNQATKKISLSEGIEPAIEVGIMFQSSIAFVLHGDFIASNGKIYSDAQTVFYQDAKIHFDKENNALLTFRPLSENAYFELKNVVIGIGFHWERKEDQSFKGALKFIVENEKITAINTVKLEDYLTSVISSEMSAKASKELLKAHAVISRSWLLHPMKFGFSAEKEEIIPKYTQNNNELIRWYERDAHTNYDVCADDHCQRYQGITKASTAIVGEVINETKGEVLMYDGKICDARFSKSCGGISETFENVWDNVHHPYLTKVLDNPETPKNFDTNLTIEKNAEKWIRHSPESFCNTKDEKILSQVLNNYDRETADFYRWQLEYSQKELSELLKMRSKIDFGDILDLIPIQRGESGRLIKLKILGTNQSIIVGKELEIRKYLSPSHLYSSAFVVDKFDIENDIPQRFVLTGAGWGHGVGLCQIGAAVMGEKGYSYDQILSHYFNKAELKKIY